MRYFNFYLLLFGLSFGLICVAQTKVYTVKSGDAISFIALFNLTAPKQLYGDSGRIARILELNPQIKDIHSIFPGDKIILPASESEPQINANHGAKPNPDAEPSPHSNLGSNSNLSSDVKANKTVGLDTNSPTEPDRKPTSETLITPSKEVESDLNIGLEVLQLFSRIDAKDISTKAKATFASDLMTELRFHITHSLDPKHQIEFSTGLLANKFSEPATGQSLTSVTSSRFIEAEYKFLKNSRFNFSLAAGQAQRIFSRAVSATEYTFDQIQTPYTRIGLNYNLRQNQRSEIAIGYAHSFLSSSSGGQQNSKSGHADEVQFRFTQIRKHFEFYETLFWNHSTQDSNLVEQSQTSLGISFGLGWRI